MIEAGPIDERIQAINEWALSQADRGDFLDELLDEFGAS